MRPSDRGKAYEYLCADLLALDRDGQISRFSYGEFAIVEATASQSQS